ncbi:MAG: FAD-dependent oxidoreductase [Pseudomonadota bacterium]|nr:FAD-dependent oxidoreductase [Pseudomonadota bacterium]
MLNQQDIVILGGGIAGLWLLNRLRNAGYAAVLLERGALGQGQSIASQGMIHGGMKYALGGGLTGASESIADMPAHWQRCLRGEGDVDLRGTQLLSDAYYMWPSRSSLRSRLNAFFGSKAVRGKVDAVAPELYPDFFRGHIDGPLYRLQDIVLDVPSLLVTLAERQRAYIHRIDWTRTRLEHDASGNVSAIALEDGTRLQARAFIFTGGEGNDELLGALRPPQVAMQRRPLQMVVVKHGHPHPVYVHCVSDQLTATPELTLTTHHCRDGSKAWYLGGELAEAGAHIGTEEQIAHAKAKVAELFPWCDMRSAQWRSLYIDRAEATQPGGKRPDHATVLPGGNVLYCWPTKLTLAPNLATRVLDMLHELAIEPGTPEAAPLNLPFPAVATPPWEDFAS